MLFWIIAAAILTGSLALLLVPLLRKPRVVDSRGEQEAAIYRDQLAEIGREVESGLIDAAEAEAAKAEVARRLLAADRDLRRTAEPAPRGRGSGPLAAGLALLLPGVAVGLYLALGSPQASNLSSAGGSAPEAPVAEHQSSDLSDAMERLAARLRQDPGDVEGWTLLARSYTAVGRFAEAAQAYQAALGLTGAEPDLQSARGEALVLAAAGIVTPQAKAAFDAVLLSRPGDPRSRYYRALAEAQSGHGARAIELWQALEAESPADAPWLPAVRQRIDATAKQYGIALAPRQPDAPGPDADDLRRAQEMPAGEQDEMIRGMVARLAARLEDQPDDLQGWLRLARSYQVLGDAAKAREALTKASAAAAKQGPDAQAAVERALIASAPPAGPSPAAAAPEGSGAPHAMAGAAVAQLAARLEAAPEDAAAWVQLGRSYAILGASADAQAAYGKALTRQPGNMKLLEAYADATLETGARGALRRLPDSSITVLRNLLAVDGQSPQALWLLGLVEAENGNLDAAAELWRRLQASLEPGSARLAAVAAELERLEVRR